jgi:hypothetical protein
LQVSEKLMTFDEQKDDLTDKVGRFSSVQVSDK